ncbi:hypothetical protein FR943_17740 [Mycobacterium sp. TNTM28]|uniref:Lipoprotein n=1 Tax=[Mycobacterium] fortunisiensis TaxID=2600579 RepID=A0ABS6KQ87_9MYCO|nr:hypothetical protein [[Mycobacterium] fortunisiensis]MBU9765680.1 hypothetical protein [[Mycobacterium] fortunisiensis]
MTQRTTTCFIAAMTIGLAVTACSSATETTTQAATDTAHATSAASGAEQLTSLLPTPGDVRQTTGPDDIADGGIHLHYQVHGAPNDVMAAYTSALEAKGWALTTIISSSGGGGGGATYTGTHDDAYGVFDGGGYADSTYIDVCAWPAKPANPNCSRGER